MARVALGSGSISKGGDKDAEGTGAQVKEELVEDPRSPVGEKITKDGQDTSFREYERLS